MPKEKVNKYILSLFLADQKDRSSFKVDLYKKNWKGFIKET